MKLHIIAFILLVIGGLNWLLVGIAQWDIGLLFGGQANIVYRIIYIVVGLAAIYEIVTHKNNCRACDGSSSTTM